MSIGCSDHVLLRFSERRMEGQEAAPIPTDRADSGIGESLSPSALRGGPMDGLGGSGLDRLLPAPGADEEPDGPHNNQELII
jgi:hypothetical protein